MKSKLRMCHYHCVGWLREYCCKSCLQMLRVNVKYHGNSTNLMNFEESPHIFSWISKVTPSMSLLNLSASKRTSISTWNMKIFPTANITVKSISFLFVMGQNWAYVLFTPFIVSAFWLHSAHEPTPWLVKSEAEEKRRVCLVHTTESQVFPKETKFNGCSKSNVLHSAEFSEERLRYRRD